MSVCGLNSWLGNSNIFNILCATVPRIPPANKNDKGDGVDPIKPVFVGEFPQVVHDEQTSFLQRRVPG